MGERQQITYMQARIVRMACRRWGMALGEVVDVFARCDVLGYLERNFGLLHMEGDEAVFEDVEGYLARRGVGPRGDAA